MLLPLSNVRQRQLADCLVACTAMVLQYLYIPLGYERLLEILGTTDAGTPFSRLDQLKQWRLAVTGGEGDMATLHTHLETGLPVIVAVHTWALPYWQNIDTEHAVVIVGLDDNDVYLLDPAFAEAPQVVDHNAFLAAWGDRDNEYTVIGLDAG